MPLNRNSSEDKRRRRKKSGSGKQLIPGSAHSDTGNVSNGGGCGSNNGGGSGNLGPRMRARTLSLGSAAGLFSSSPPHHQNLAHSLGAVSKKILDGEVDFFSDQQVQCTGSIFRHRDCLSSLYMQLPRWKRNGIHIKMEDDCPQGNDETRIFVLTSLGDKKMRDVNCVLCNSSMYIYDRYPLIDGTFFMSPLNHCNMGVKVKHDGKEGYILAICVQCLEHSSRFRCARCGSRDWFPGDRLVLGTLYTFDVLACQVCCSPVCSACQKMLPVPANHAFSAFSEPSVCPNCGHSDLHFIRRLENVRCLVSTNA